MSLRVFRKAMTRSKGDKANAERFLRESVNLSYIEPKPGYREAAFARILERLSREEETISSGKIKAPVFPGILRRAVVVPVAVLILLIVFTSGAYAFSYSSTPDSAFYPMKRFFEKANLYLTGGLEAKAYYQLGLLGKRLRELEGMVTRGCSRGGSRWQHAYQESSEWLYEHLPSLGEAQQEEIYVYLESVLGEHLERMEMIKGSCTPELLPYVNQVQEINRSTVTRLRQRHMRKGSEEEHREGVDNENESGGDSQGGGGTAPDAKGGGGKSHGNGDGQGTRP